MTSINFEEIFSEFLGSITDYNILSLEQSDAYALMTEYLHKSVSEPYVYRLFSTLNIDDEIQEISYEMKYPIDDEIDRRFLITALAKWMVYEWLHEQVRSITNLKQMFGGKEQKFFSQAQHLAELRGLQDDALAECRMFIQNRGWVSNSYVDGGVS